MDSDSFTHAAPSHVDTSTECEDAQARLGNVKPKPKPAKPEKFTASFDDAGALASRRNDAVDASTSDGDDFDDEVLGRAIHARACARWRPPVESLPVHARGRGLLGCG